MIKSWSYSRIKDYKSCKYKAYLKHVERVPDPNPSPAADRGTAIHTMAEHYVMGNISTLPQELAKFKEDFAYLRDLHAAGQVSLEGEWGFDKDWAVTDYRSAWGRIKADGVVHLDAQRAVVIDYKTGKKFGNEVSHAEQTQLYSLAVFLREPDIQTIKADLWYLDHGLVSTLTITRTEALAKYLKYWDKSAKQMTTATEFPPNPNQFSCKWCPYKPSGTGHCKVGV